MSTFSKIFIYDNIGIDIPSKISVYPVDVVLGDTISKIHENIPPCKLFCVFTHIHGKDIIVPDEKDKSILRSVLKFGHLDYKVDVKSNSIWYTDKAEKNIIFSDTVDLTSEQLSTLISMYISELVAKEKAENKYRNTVYFVRNVRNNEELIRTPNLEEAIRICNSKPCTAVYTRDNKIVYRTKFGKVAVPLSSNGHVAKMKALHKDSNGVFKFIQR